MLTFHVFYFCNPHNTTGRDSSLQTLTQCSHIKKETKPFKKEKRTSAILGKGIANETENTIMLSHCTFSSIFLQLIIAFQNTCIIPREDTDAGNRTTRGTERFLYEETLNGLQGSTDYTLLSHLLQYTLM